MNPIETLAQLASYPTKIAMSVLALAQVDLERRVAEEEYAKAHPPQVEVARRRPSAQAERDRSGNDRPSASAGVPAARGQRAAVVSSAGLRPRFMPAMGEWFKPITLMKGGGGLSGPMPRALAGSNPARWLSIQIKQRENGNED